MSHNIIIISIKNSRNKRNIIINIYLLCEDYEIVKKWIRLFCLIHMRVPLIQLMSTYVMGRHYIPTEYLSI